MSRPRRILATVALSASILLVGAPAYAHPEDGAPPTNYRSEVVSIEPDPGVIRAWIGGGDSWLSVEVEPGHEVVIFGYGGQNVPPEPYLRIDPDGSVHINGSSPATWMNEDRYAQIDIPEHVDAAAEPRWQIIAVAGTHLAEWHDHRTHWMSPVPPAQVRADQRSEHHLYDWEVPIEVDGVPVTIHGTLRWLPSASPLLPLAVGLAAIAAAFLATRRWEAVAAAAAATLAGATGVTVALASALHPESTTGPLEVLLPVAALLAGLVGLLPRSRIGPGAAVVAGVTVGMWGAPLATTLTRPVRFTYLDAGIVDVLVPLALGLAVGAAIAVFVSPMTAPAAEEEPVDA